MSKLDYKKEIMDSLKEDATVTGVTIGRSARNNGRSIFHRRSF